MFEKKIMCPPLLLHPLQGSPARVLTSFRPPSTPLGPCWALQLLWEIGGWEALYWCWLLTSPPLLRPCWARQLWEVPGDDNSSHCRLVPLYLGVPHWEVHLGGWSRTRWFAWAAVGYARLEKKGRREKLTNWHLGISDTLLRRVAFAIPAIFFFVSKIACFLKNRALWPQRAWILPRWKSKRLYFLCVGQTTIN